MRSFCTRCVGFYDDAKRSTVCPHDELPPQGDAIIMNPPNSGPQMERVWAFISRDEQGRENVCGAHIGEAGLQPLMTGNENLLEHFKSIANQMRCYMAEIAGDQKTIHLVEFSSRKEITEW